MRLALKVPVPFEPAQRFDALTSLLTATRSLWTPRPFVHRILPWEQDHPEVGRWLRKLCRTKANALDTRPHTPPAEAPSTFRGWAADAGALVEIPNLSGPAITSLEAKRLRMRVPARKWQQVCAFAAAALPYRPAESNRALDWCAGKGHLGRALHLATGLPTVSLERRADLCDQAEQLATFFGAHAYRTHAVDVLEFGQIHLEPGTFAVGLHACGILWRTLLDAAADTGTSAAIAPCCYHNLGGARSYQPLSDAGRAANLRLDQPHLRLAVAEAVVARPAIVRAREHEQTYRLGLDLLLREASGVDEYMPQGAFPKPWFDLDFASFCRRAAEALERKLPSRFDPDAARRAGEMRAEEVYALAQVRALFRRPLELWLVLDAAMAQLEQDRQVRLGTFCATQLTPRNILMIATP